LPPGPDVVSGANLDRGRRFVATAF
jgi:hypothetical protein